MFLLKSELGYRFLGICLLHRRSTIRNLIYIYLFIHLFIYEYLLLLINYLVHSTCKVHSTLGSYNVWSNFSIETIRTHTQVQDKEAYPLSYTSIFNYNYKFQLMHETQHANTTYGHTNIVYILCTHTYTQAYKHINTHMHTYTRPQKSIRA